MSRHERMMAYCDGNLPGPYTDTPREHLRTDILSLNDDLNTCRAVVADLRDELETAVQLVRDAGLATGHADNYVELMREVLDQYEELRVRGK